MYRLLITQKSLKAALFSLLLISLAACSMSNKVVKTYEGEVLSKEQLAVLSAPANITVLSVNGKAMQNYLLSNLNTKYGLKSGSNQVVFQYESLWAKPGTKASGGARSEKIESPPHSVSFEAKVGEHYTFSFKAAENVREARQLAANFAATLVDAQGHELAMSKLYEFALADAASLAQKTVDVVQVKALPSGRDSASKLDDLKIIWGEMSAKERKAFLAWAFQD